MSSRKSHMIAKLGCDHVLFQYSATRPNPLLICRCKSPRILLALWLGLLGQDGAE